MVAPEAIAPIALHGMKVLGEHYEDIAHHGKKGWDGIQRFRSQRKADQAKADYNAYGRDSRRHPRAKSAGDYYDRERGRGRGRRDSYDDYDDYYESEASPPPVHRKRRSSGQEGTRSSQAVSQRGGGKSSSSSNSGSSSSSTDTDELGSSTDDEKKHKKLRRGELITGGLAAVASVHAAGTVWNSMNARDAREEAVANGELTKDEAKRERRKNQFQDVAALGLAALAIKGAYGKWKGTAAQHQSKKEHERAKQERHAKRVAKGVDRASRRYGSVSGSVNGGDSSSSAKRVGNGDSRRQITDGRPSYNRAYSHSENDLGRGRYYEDEYDDRDRGGYYYDDRDSRGRGGGR